MNKAEELIACLEGEIAKRDARIAELEAQYQRDVCGLNNEGDPIGGDPAGGYANDNARLRAELAAIKAQESVRYWFIGDAGQEKGSRHCKKSSQDGSLAFFESEFDAKRAARRHAGTEVYTADYYASPVSEAKAQGEYGDAYQGAREDLAIWKRRALEAEEKVLQQEQIIDHLTSEAQGESRFGEPVVTPDAPRVPGGYVLADKKALGTVLQALVNAPHHIRELQATRQPVELFSDNPINVLIANYEAPAAPVQQVSVPGGWRELLRDIEQFFEGAGVSPGPDIELHMAAMLAATPAAPAADAGLVAVEWERDAEEWGPALNGAGWLFLSELNEDPQKSALIFNNTKGPLRAAIMKYAEIVAANAKDSSHD